MIAPVEADTVPTMVPRATCDERGPTVLRRTAREQRILVAEITFASTAASADVFALRVWMVTARKNNTMRWIDSTSELGSSNVAPHEFPRERSVIRDYQT